MNQTMRQLYQPVFICGSSLLLPHPVLAQAGRCAMPAMTIALGWIFLPGVALPALTGFCLGIVNLKRKSTGLRTASILCSIPLFLTAIAVVLSAPTWATGYLLISGVLLNGTLAFFSTSRS